MFGIFIAIIGFLLIITMLYLVLREVRREAEVKFKPDASFYDEMQRYDDEIERLRNEVDGMNESFYEVVDGLNDRLNDFKREMGALKKNQVDKLKNEEVEVMLDVTSNVRKSDSYHQYEMKDHLNKSTDLVKEARIFPEQGVRRKIIDLNSQGKTPAEIAKCVDKGIGEVQLILNLLRNT